jgi:hypothetical protein
MIRNQNQLQNTFENGLNQDLNVLNVQPDMLTDALNVTLITANSNEFILQSEKGNVQVADILGSDNLSSDQIKIPLACQTYNGIAYIISGVFSNLVGGSLYKENGNTVYKTFVRGEIGTYPSPDYSNGVGDLANGIDIKGNLVNVYKPIQNYDDYLDVGGTSKTPNNITGVVGSFISTGFNFTIDSSLQLEIQSSFDGTVNLIFTDNVNPPRLINSYFAVQTGNKYKIFAKLNNLKNSDLYTKDSFNNTANLIQSTDKLLDIELADVISAGQLACGTYRYYFKYGTQDNNLTDVIAESMDIPIYIGNSVATTRGDVSGTATDKAIVFDISNIDTNYAYLQIFYTYYAGDNSDVTSAYQINQTYKITGTHMGITVYGFELVQTINADELSVTNVTIDTMRTITQCQGRLFGGNVKQKTYDYSAMELFAQKIVPGYDIDYSDSTADKGLHYYGSEYPSLELSKFNEVFNYNDKSGGGFKGAYYNPKNVYYKLGYWGGESYMVGIVFILSDGSESPVFTISDADDAYKNLNKPSLDFTPGTHGIYRFPSRDDLSYQMKNGARVKPIHTRVNTNVDTAVYENRLTVLKLSLDFSAAGTYPTNTVGFYITRAKRNPNVLVQGYMVDTIPVQTIDQVDSNQTGQTLGEYNNVAPYNSKSWYSKTFSKLIPAVDFTVEGSASYSAEGPHRRANKGSGDKDTPGIFPFKMGKYFANYDVQANWPGPQPAPNYVWYQRKPDTDTSDFWPASLPALTDSVHLANNHNFGTTSFAFYSPDIITVPHNYTSQFSLLTCSVNILNRVKMLKSVPTTNGGYIYANTGNFDGGQFYSWYSVLMPFGYDLDPAPAISGVTNLHTNHKSWTQRYYPAQAEYIFGAVNNISNNRYTGQANFNIESGQGYQIGYNFKEPATHRESRNFYSGDFGVEYAQFNDYIGLTLGVSVAGSNNVAGFSYAALSEYAVFNPPGLEGRNDATYLLDKQICNPPNNDDTLPDDRTNLTDPATGRTYGSTDSVFIANIYPYNSTTGFYPSDPTDSVFRDPLRPWIQTVAVNQPQYSAFFAISKKMYWNDSYAVTAGASGITVDLMTQTTNDIYYLNGEKIDPKVTTLTGFDKTFEGLFPNKKMKVYGGDCFMGLSFRRLYFSSQDRNFNPSIPSNPTWLGNIGSVLGMVTENNVNPAFRSLELYSSTEEGKRKFMPYGTTQFNLAPSTGASTATTTTTVPGTGTNPPTTTSATGVTTYNAYDVTSVYNTWRYYRQPESALYNRGFGRSDGSKIKTSFNPNTPFVQTSFDTRIVYSGQYINSSFSNAYRIFTSLAYGDYSKELGAIVRLVSMNEKLICVQEHGVSIVPISQQVVVANADSGGVFTQNSGVLPPVGAVAQLSKEFGSKWIDSIVATDNSVYGIDTDKNKVWKISGEGLTLISEFKIQSALRSRNDFYGKQPIKGTYDIKSYYNKVLNDVLFVFYNKQNDSYTIPSTYTLSYSETVDKWKSFHSYHPVNGFVIYDKFHTFNLLTDQTKIWLHNSNPIINGKEAYCNFYGIQHPMMFEFVVKGETSIQAIFDNLLIVSDSIPPNEISMVSDNNNVYQLIVPRVPGNLASANHRYIENIHYIQLGINLIGKFDSNNIEVNPGTIVNVPVSSARIRDKYLRMRLIYRNDSGLPYIYVQRIKTAVRYSYN